MLLKSCEYKKLNEHCIVVNINEVDEYLSVRLPFNMHGFKLYDILDVSSSPVKTVSFENVKYDEFHPWVDIPWKNLSKLSGKHVYKLSFMDSLKNRYFTTYVSYIIQDDDPHKPYVYMNSLHNPEDAEKQGIYLGWY